MANFTTLKVAEIIQKDDQLIKVLLDDGSKAYAFPQINGKVELGDEVVVNTTAVDRKLGTGGWHFIVWNLSNKKIEIAGDGHIMKMRYSPLQIDSGVAEEHEYWNDELLDIRGLTVIAAPLHSHLPAIASFLKSKNQNINIAYLQSDGAALPTYLSDLLKGLKERNLIDCTISFGHAFGADVEALNIYTALLSAKNIAKADVAIVSMGPGIVGTNTTYGFTGIEVAHHLDVAKKLGGSTIGVLRASAADPRDRHKGISHHSITTYSKATFLPHKLGIISDNDLSSKMFEQIDSSGIRKLHELKELNSVGIVDIMEDFELNVTSMGRKAREDELFFEMAAASAQIYVDTSVG